MSRVRRIALFSDVHGNLPALDAVLADIDASATDSIFCLGDLVGYGPDPAGVIECIRERAIPTIQGNYDEGIGQRRGECGCYYATEQARLDGAASYEFTEAVLNDVDHEWLARLPQEIRLEHAGVRLLLAHGSPRKNNEYLLPDRSDDQLRRLAESAESDVVCIGHVHVPYHRTLAGSRGQLHYVSSGSVGKPKDGDPRACWVELLIGSEPAVREAAAEDSACALAGTTDTWVGFTLHHVAYDIASVQAHMAQVGLPLSLAEALARG